MHLKQVLDHERHITKLIHELYEVAVEEKDYALQTFAALVLLMSRLKKRKMQRGS